MKWLIYGANGWIGTQVCKLFEESTRDIVYKGKSRVDDTVSLKNEILTTKPDRIISVVGRTYGDKYRTIDYLEQPGKLVENVRDNLFGPMSLALICKELNIHLTYLGTGCIFSSSPDDIHDSFGYEEEDTPDFFGSSYSTVKGFTDRLMHQMNVLNVRIRMPIVGYDNARNFITKITKYDKVVNIQNSMTVLPDLLPVMIDLAKKSHIGTINLTNPGTISHNEILDMYTELVNTDFKYSNFSIEDQDKILASKRSNNKLNTNKLESLYPYVKNIKDSIKQLLENWNYIA